MEWHGFCFFIFCCCDLFEDVKKRERPSGCQQQVSRYPVRFLARILFHCVNHSVLNVFLVFPKLKAIKNKMHFPFETPKSRKTRKTPNTLYMKPKSNVRYEAFKRRTWLIRLRKLFGARPLAQTYSKTTVSTASWSSWAA